MVCLRLENCSIFVHCCSDKCRKSRNFRFNTFRTEIESGAIKNTNCECNEPYHMRANVDDLVFTTIKVVIEHKVNFLVRFAKSIFSFLKLLGILHKAEISLIKTSRITRIFWRTLQNCKSTANNSHFIQPTRRAKCDHLHAYYHLHGDV